jgi:hypothetical protein
MTKLAPSSIATGLRPGVTPGSSTSTRASDTSPQTRSRSLSPANGLVPRSRTTIGQARPGVPRTPSRSDADRVSNQRMGRSTSLGRSCLAQFPSRSCSNTATRDTGSPPSTHKMKRKQCSETKRTNKGENQTAKTTFRWSVTRLGWFPPQTPPLPRQPSIHRADPNRRLYRIERPSSRPEPDRDHGDNLCFRRVAVSIQAFPPRLNLNPAGG